MPKDSCRIMGRITPQSRCSKSRFHHIPLTFEFLLTPRLIHGQDQGKYINAPPNEIDRPQSPASGRSTWGFGVSFASKVFSLLGKLGAARCRHIGVFIIPEDAKQITNMREPHIRYQQSKPQQIDSSETKVTQTDTNGRNWAKVETPEHWGISIAQFQSTVFPKIEGCSPRTSAPNTRLS